MVKICAKILKLRTSQYLVAFGGLSKNYNLKLKFNKVELAPDRYQKGGVKIYRPRRVR